jgi:phenylacetate-CoA ligase
LSNRSYPAPVAEADRELWDPPAQSMPADVLEQLRAEAFAREWERLWWLPIPFYQDKFRAAGLDAGKTPTLDDVPATSKRELLADTSAHPPVGRYRSVTLANAIRVGSSTGTTGDPFLWFFGKRDVEAIITGQLRQLWRAGVRPGDRFTHAWPGGLYSTNVAGGRHHVRLGTLELPMGLPADDQVAASHLRLWQLLQPTAFQITMPQIELYASVGDKVGIDFATIFAGAKVITVEALLQFDEPRRRFEELWGVRVHNMSGASEVPGLISTDCRFRTGLHTPAASHVVQIVDAAGRQVPPGERGRIVVTALGLDAFIMRYDLQDIGVAHDGECPCGETGTRYTFLGRAADAARVSGRTILPLDVQLALIPLGSPEARMVSGPTDRLEVTVEAPAQDRGRIARVLEDATRVPARVDTVPAGTLPRSRFKPRRAS